MEPIVGIGTVIDFGPFTAKVSRIFAVKQLDKFGNTVIIPKVTLEHDSHFETIWGKEIEEML